VNKIENSIVFKVIPTLSSTIFHFRLIHIDYVILYDESINRSLTEINKFFLKILNILKGYIIISF